MTRHKSFCKSTRRESLAVQRFGIFSELLRSGSHLDTTFAFQRFRDVFICPTPGKLSYWILTLWVMRIKEGEISRKIARLPKKPLSQEAVDSSQRGQLSSTIPFPGKCISISSIFMGQLVTVGVSSNLRAETTEPLKPPDAPSSGVSPLPPWLAWHLVGGITSYAKNLHESALST